MSTTKNKGWSTFKEIIFIYLAINKIMYWYNTVLEMGQSDLENVGSAVLMRLLAQDLQLIIGVVAIYFLGRIFYQKKHKYNTFSQKLIFYGICYFVVMGIGFVYNFGMIVIFWAQDINFGEFVLEYISFVPAVSLAYLVVVAVLEIKLLFKNKAKETEKEIFEE